MSIADSKTVGRLIAEIKLLKDTHKGGFLLVEGDSDSRFWRARVQSQKCEVINSGGKTNVLGVASVLDVQPGDHQEESPVLGVVDADFDHFEQVVYSPRLAVTDCHDLETVLMSSEAFNRIMAEYADETGCKQLESSQGKTLHSILMGIALQFGRLRYLHHREGYNFSFAKFFSVYRYVSAEDFSFNFSGLMQDFAIHSATDVTELEDKFQLIPSQPVQQLVQGHDVLNLLCIALRNRCKRSGGQSPGESDIARALRLAFHRDDLCQTSLYQALLEKDQARGLNMLPVCS